MDTGSRTPATAHEAAAAILNLAAGVAQRYGLAVACSGQPLTGCPFFPARACVVCVLSRAHRSLLDHLAEVRDVDDHDRVIVGQGLAIATASALAVGLDDPPDLFSVCAGDLLLQADAVMRSAFAVAGALATFP